MKKTKNELFNLIPFTLRNYEELVDAYGLKKVWNVLAVYLKENGCESFSNNIVNFYDIGRLYEIGLARENKYSKKEAGKYYTPRDVSKLMAELLCSNSYIDCVADVGCGCGNLIIEVLSIIKNKSEEQFEKIKNNIYLYDLDETALNICKARIMAKFNIDENLIHSVCGDFLNKQIRLPHDCFIISNPPYSKITKINQDWEYKESITESKDLYVGFIEKMIRNANKVVIVSPQSYIVGSNFTKLRKALYKYGGGEIYSFDNVPGTLFNGKKEGVFNTNTANGVRASILLFDKFEPKGYRLTHLIRFKSDQRGKVVDYNYIKDQLGSKRQDLIMPLKCFKEFEEFVYSISKEKNISDLLETNDAKHCDSLCLYINTSARYFVVGSHKKLSRDGMFELYAKDEESFYKLYALLNSSYTYLWWRMLDGGILIPRSLLLRIPLPKDDCFNDEIVNYCKNMIKHENNYLVYKKNAGVVQESIKFPEKYRNELNKLMFGDYCFEIIHSNKEEV